MTTRDTIDRAANDEAAKTSLHARKTGAAGLLPPIDPVTGEVTGSGSGTGGGNPGEDYDDDHTAGSNTVR